MPHVMIDGVEYVPVRQVIIDRDRLVKGLLAQYSPLDDKTPEAIERLEHEVFVIVTDNPQRYPCASVHEFLARLSR